MSHEIDMTGVASSRRAEMARRIDIVRRYLAIDLPAEEDDRRFAAELGLTKDTLYRLAAAWKEYGRASALHGASERGAKREPSAVAAAAAAASRDVDLRDVAPERRAETRQRVAQIGAFLKIAQPKREDREQAARDLGITVTHFNRLLRAWIRYRKASALPGAKAYGRRPRRRGRRMDRIDAILAEVVADLGLDLPVPAIHEELVVRCRAEGIKSAGINAVYGRITALRARRGNFGPTTAILIDHAILGIVADEAGTSRLPFLSVAALVPSGRLIAHSISLSRPTAATAAQLLARALSAADASAAEVPLALGGIADIEGGENLSNLLARAGMPVNSSDHPPAARTLRTITGGKIGNLGLQGFPRVPMKASTLRKYPGHVRPLAPKDLAEAVSSAIEAHNGADTRATAVVPRVVGQSGGNIGSLMEFVRSCLLRDPPPGDTVP